VTLLAELRNLLDEHEHCLPFQGDYNADYQCSMHDELTTILRDETPGPPTFRSFFLHAGNIHNDNFQTYGPFPLETYNDQLIGPSNTYESIVLNGQTLASFSDDWSHDETFTPWQDQEGDDARTDGWRMSRTIWTHQPTGNHGVGHQVQFDRTYTDINITISTNEPIDMNSWNRVAHDPACFPWCPDTPNPPRVGRPMPLYEADLEPQRDSPTLTATAPTQTFRDGW
jgi:hypothetical protein